MATLSDVAWARVISQTMAQVMRANVMDDPDWEGSAAMVELVEGR